VMVLTRSLFVALVAVVILNACDRFEKSPPAQPAKATNATYSPVKVDALNGSVIKVAAGVNFTCAIVQTSRAETTAWCWGKNDKGQLGNGKESTYESTPVRVGNLTDVSNIAAAEDFACAIYGSDNRVACWGDASHNKLGHAFNEKFPAKLPPASTEPKRTLRERIQVRPAFSASPMDIYETEAHVLTYVNPAHLYADHNRVCVVLPPNDIPVCWGDIRKSSVENDSSDPKAPHMVIKITSADNVEYPTTIVTQDPGVEQWHSTTSFAILERDACTLKAKSLQCLTRDFGAKGLMLSNNEDQTCMLRKNDTSDRGKTVACFTGNGNLTDMPAFEDFVVRLTALRKHTCVLLKNGKAVCWGRDDVGQLGNGFATQDGLGPTAVLGLAEAVDLSAGGSHTCAVVKNDRSLWCWGSNAFGQLGPNGPSPEKDS
jgi:alpha-tubulin suppressor-like RCC1 family protein